MERRKRSGQCSTDQHDEEAAKWKSLPPQEKRKTKFIPWAWSWSCSWGENVTMPVCPRRWVGISNTLKKYPGRCFLLFLAAAIIQRPSRIHRWPARAQTVIHNFAKLQSTPNIFGGHPATGGPHGEEVDRQNRLRKLQLTTQKVQQELSEWHLPKLAEQRRDPGGNIILNDVNFYTAIREVVRRQRDREARWQQLRHPRNESNQSRPRIYWIASHVLLRASIASQNQVAMIRVSDREMKELVRREGPGDWIDHYDSWSQSRQQLAFTILILYKYGGIVVLENEVEHYLYQDEEDTVTVLVSRSNHTLALAASPPEHSLWECLIRTLHVQNMEWENMSHIQAHLQRSCSDAYRRVESWNLVPATKDHEKSPGGVAEVVLHHDIIDPVYRSKLGYDDILKQAAARPDWHCMRCLKSPLMGTYELCQKLCPKQYHKMLCTSSSEHETDIRALLKMKSHSRTIPRIIHQTWFDEVGMDRYPELTRIQNSWKSQGWEYRFYTDDMARRYIEDHFPSLFLDAFDALIHGAFKADYFRYLVLLREGGVYADVDVMLETNLDHFITPSISFFVPRDSVLEYADEPFCLWNGLIGAAPGHPVLAQVVQDTTSLILRRADVYDMERLVCTHHKSLKLEVWKLWAEPLLLLTGPCALGMALNVVMGRNPVEKIEYGLLEIKRTACNDPGDALILVGDKYDMGLFRFSDPDRGIILASTNLDALLGKEPLQNDALPKKEILLRPKHYSESSRNVAIWGSSNVYKDNNSSEILFNLQPPCT